MKQICILLAASGFLSQSVFATTFWTEPFANYVTGRLGDAGAGNTGGVPGWYTAQAEITVTNGSGSLNGTGLGLVASSGDRVFIAANDINNGAYNKFIPQSSFPTGTETNIYTSFLYQFTVGTDVSTVDQVISAMNRQNSGFTSTATFSWYLHAKRTGNDIQLGLSRVNGTTTNYTSKTVIAGETFFVVVRQHIIPTATTPDEIDLWINPPAESFGTDESTVPPADATTSDGTDDTSNSGPGRFWIVASGAAANIDEIRIANTWAEATPPTGQCISAGVESDPESVTQVAGISATFEAVGSGTSPSYQWQISQNGGTSWNDIEGAAFDSYTTPNLTLANDNGNQYRVIVTVPCDNSSATSAVASVTLTAPIPTPLGVVMDDTFLDPDLGFDSRNNTPITASNSVWFTALSDNNDTLVTFNQGGNMVGTPLSGSSSLWLGYFVENTNEPVHLDVGQAIKITLPFIPSSFGSHTENAALRFGLFDYADGGIRVITDSSSVSGSAGNGMNVRGYMLSLDFGPTFSANSPLSLLARTGLGDNNLMGTTGAYSSMGSGPSGGGYTDAPAFQAGTEYTLEFTVARTGENSVDVTAAISGGGTNWLFTASETNFAYHRFDAFAIRPNSLETSADSFIFPEFKVEVIAAVIPVLPFNITEVQNVAAGGLKLTWDSIDGRNYQIQSRESLSSGDWITNATVTAVGTSSSYTNFPTPGTSQQFYRVVATP